MVLLVFGDGPERGRLASCAMVRTSLHGFRAQKSESFLATALASADLFVHHSACETFGLSVAQAIAGAAFQSSPPIEAAPQSWPTRASPSSFGSSKCRSMRRGNAPPSRTRRCVPARRSRLAQRVPCFGRKSRSRKPWRSTPRGELCGGAKTSSAAVEELRHERPRIRCTTSRPRGRRIGMVEWR